MLESDSMRRSLVLMATLSLVLVSGCSHVPEVDRTAPQPAPTQAQSVEVAQSADNESEAVASASAPEDVDSSSAEVTGERDKPMKIGDKRSVAQGSAYIVSLASINLNAAEEVMARNEFLEPPVEGHQYILANVNISIDADALKKQDSKALDNGFSAGRGLIVRYVDAQGGSYEVHSANNSCFLDDALYMQPPVYSAEATVNGTACFLVPSDKVAGGMVHISNMRGQGVWIKP